MAEQQEAKWYVAHTYSGYENKVKNDLEQTIQNRPDLEGLIEEVVVPMEECIEERNGKQVTVAHKTFPGYVLVRMIMNELTWYVVRNTRGVTGFVGPGSEPVSLTPEEIDAMNIFSTKYAIKFAPGDEVQIVEGPYEGSVAVVSDVNQATGKVTVTLTIFMREVSVELSFEQIKKI